MTDFVVLAERWHWQPSEIDNLYFDESCLLADVVRDFSRQEAEAAAKNRGR